MTVPDHSKVVIIGGGPAAMAAAIYTGRAGLSPIVFLGIETSSQLTTTTHVENYPGFKSILGPDLVQNMIEQAQGCGANVFYEDVLSIDLSKKPYSIKHGFEDHSITCDSIIYCTGAKATRLDVPGEKQFWQKGVSACAVCDSAMAKNKVTMVVGGGDVACEEAVYLTAFASKVIQVLRRDQFRASKALSDRVLNNSKIQVVYDSGVEEILGDKKINAVNLKNFKTGKVEKVEVGALFWAIGHKPATDLLAGQVKLDQHGYVALGAQSQETSVPGFFAAGDCADPVYKQAAVAAGAGVKAALDAERYLQTLK